ncbi:MAG: ABC transporter substrate-binding protein [bacterium]
MRILLVFAALALVATLAVFMRPDPPIVIGAVYPTAGTHGSGGLEEFRGLQLAAEYANRAGGVRGKRLVVALAEAGSWDAAPYAIERLATRGVRIVVGSYGSTVSVPAAETAARMGMVFWETGAVAGFSMRSVAGERTFRFTAAGLALGRASVSFTRDQLAERLGRDKPLRYAVTYVDDVYGRAVGEGAIQAIRESGLPLVAVLPYKLQRVDYDALARSIARSGADVLVVGAYLDDGVALRRAIVRARVPLLASIGTSSSHCMPAFGDMLGDDAVGLFASDKPDGDILRVDALAPDAAAALVWSRTTYRKRFGAAMTAPALTGFAGGLALFQYVLPRADEVSPAAVARAAQAVKLPKGTLPNGSGLAFAAFGQPDAGNNMNATSVIWQWVAPRTRAVVWPPAYATHPIVIPTRTSGR